VSKQDREHRRIDAVDLHVLRVERVAHVDRVVVGDQPLVDLLGSTGGALTMFWTRPFWPMMTFISICP
jgi:hypothetical protein